MTITLGRDYDHDGGLDWQQRQDYMKRRYEEALDLFRGEERFYYKRQCVHCQREFYTKSKSGRYCMYSCSMDAYVDKRRLETPPKSYTTVCKYCQKPFNSNRIDRQYCCNSHRVLACLERKKDKPMVTTWWASPMGHFLLYQ
jgi:hypothetical protein